MSYWKIGAVVVAVSAAVWVLSMFALSLTAKRPGGLGVREGKLSPCPESPNCVCSQGADGSHAVEALTFADAPAAAWARLRRVVDAQPRAAVVESSEDYLHVECTSAVFRFVDDLEFRLDRDAKAIHVRSASRAGRSDLGVNRDRVERLRRAFAQE